MNRLPLLFALLLALATPAAAQPDLNGGDLLFPVPNRVDPGDTFELPFVVSNSGTSPAPPFEVAIYFSTDRFVSDDDSLLTRIPFEGIDPQQNAFESATLTTPDVPRGGYFVVVSIDDADEVDETDETNNLSRGLITVGGSPDSPDLLIGTGELEDEEAEPGDRISFEYRVLNQGGSDVGDFEVGYYLSPESFPSPNAVLVEREVLGGLEMGEGEDESEQVTVPDLPPGDYGLFVVADDRNLIEERNETNNSLGIGILTVTTPTASEDGLAAPALRLDVWPNPASGTVRLTYALAASGRARLILYDVLGREVAVAADGARTAGDHEATLDLSALPSGRYVVVLDAGGERAVRPITVAH
jgi:subtilase family serine protease